MWESETLHNSTEQPSSESSSFDPMGLSELCVYIVIFTLSVTGNSLVILSVLLFDKMKVVPNLFIANLAVCDLTTTVFSIPFDLVETHLGFFPYGRVMCKLLWPLATLSTTSAALTLLAISCDRYITINHPLKLGLRITRNRCLKIIALVHLVSFIAVLPYGIFLRYSEEPLASCGEQWPEGAPFSKMYTILLFVLQYAVPLLVMSVIYLQLGLVLFKNTREAHKLSMSGADDSAALNVVIQRKRQNLNITKMFLIVVVIFLVFMMPHQVLYLFLDYANSEVLQNNIDLVRLVCRAFTYTNAVLNVVIYGACNRSFRATFKSIVKCQCSEERRKGRKTHGGGGYVLSPGTDGKLKGSEYMAQRPHHSNGTTGKRECQTESDGKSRNRKLEHRSPRTQGETAADIDARPHPVQMDDVPSPRGHEIDLEKKGNIWNVINPGHLHFIRETVL